MWLPVVGAWVLIVTTVISGRGPMSHEVHGFATQEACQTFQQQLAQAYRQAELQTVIKLGVGRTAPVVLAQRTSTCRERP